MEETYDPATLVSLPREMQQMIAMDLDIQSTLNFGLGAQALKAAIIDDENFWRTKYQKDIGPEKMYDFASWFENYKMSANGVLDFKFNEEGNIEIYLGKRLLGSMGYYEHWDLYTEDEWFDALDFKGLIINREVTLKFRNGKYTLTVTGYDGEGGFYFVGMDLELTKQEVVRLFRAMRSAMYED